MSSAKMNIILIFMCMSVKYMYITFSSLLDGSDCSQWLYQIFLQAAVYGSSNIHTPSQQNA